MYNVQTNQHSQVGLLTSQTNIGNLVAQAHPLGLSIIPTGTIQAQALRTIKVGFTTLVAVAKETIIMVAIMAVLRPIAVVDQTLAGHQHKTLSMAIVLNVSFITMSKSPQ